MSTNIRRSADVIDLQARRRCHYEARGLDPVSVAARVLADTGVSVPVWDTGTDPDGDGGWAA